MTISSTGDNLNILISCNYTVCDNWMAFLCWYSLTKNLPDANVLIACNRTSMNSRLFDWPQKCKVPFEIHRATDQAGQIALVLEKKLVSVPLVVLRPETVAVRDFEEIGFDTQLLEGKVLQANDIKDLCCEAKEDVSCVFATYSNGWGKFVTSGWIDKVICPFASPTRFVDRNMTANELRIGQLWGAVTPLFQAISRG